jgi:hypothetical protein
MLLLEELFAPRSEDILASRGIASPWISELKNAHRQECLCYLEAKTPIWRFIPQDPRDGKE